MVDPDAKLGPESRRGQCLCGAVRYEVESRLREIVVCHCVECRRWHGGPAPYTAAPRETVRIGGPLRWVDSPESDARARRAFCGECGSSLFWDAPGRDTLSIAAGSLEDASGLGVEKHIYTDSR